MDSSTTSTQLDLGGSTTATRALPSPRSRALHVLAGDKQSLLTVEESGSLVGVIKLIANPQQGFDPSKVAQLSAFGERLQAVVPTVATKGAVLEVTPIEEAMLNLLLEQSRARVGLETRVRHVCRSCGRERLTNPTYEQLRQRNKRITTAAQTLGMVLSPVGITSFFAISSLLGYAKLDPDFSCLNCQGIEADESVIVFCPQCHAQRNEALLRTCPQCKHDFVSAVGLGEVWRPRGDRLLTLAESPGVRLVAEFHTDPVEKLVFTPDGSALLVGSTGNRVALWSAPPRAGGTQPETCWSVKGAGEHPLLALTPDGRRLAVTSRAYVFDAPIRFYDLATGEEQHPLAGELNKSVTDLAFSADGGTLVLAAAELELLDLTSGNVVRTLKPGFLAPTWVALSPDGELIVSDATRKLFVWRMSDGSPVTKVSVATGYTGLAFSCDSRHLVATSGNKAWVVGMPGGGTEAEIDTGAAVTSQCFDGEGNLVLGTATGQVVRYSLTGTQLGRLECDGSVDAVACGPDARLAAGTCTGTVYLWMLDTAAALEAGPASPARVGGGAEP